MTTTLYALAILAGAVTPAMVAVMNYRDAKRMRRVK